MDEKANRAQSLLAGQIAVINIGLPQFSDVLRAEGVPVVQVEWSPPAGGDARMIALLDRMGV